MNEFAKSLDPLIYRHMQFFLKAFQKRLGEIV